jgi:hypothetical protein
MAYDYRKLLGKIVEVFGKQYVFADKMDWSERTCSLKLCGKVEWKQSDISKACGILEIPINDISTYFFNQKVLC